MSRIEKVDLDPYGVVSDTNPFDVDSEWTGVSNMRFNNLAAEKFGGVVLGTNTTNQAYHLQFNGNHVNPLWIYMGDGEIRTTDFSTDTDIDTNNLASTSATNWTSSLFNNFPVMCNEVDPPMTWLNKFANPVEFLPAWDVNLLAKSVRPYRGFLIAMNITEGAELQATRLIWSDLADNGALPASWDISDPTTLAGDVYLTQDKAEIIDGLALRDFFVIYKTHSMDLMRLTGGQNIMSFQTVQINSGLLAKNCVQEFKGKHFIVSDADVVLFDGQTVESIADKRVRAEIFTDIDVENYRNSFVVRYDRQDEMWFCYPTQGQSTPNKAAIWNWKDNVWTFRDLDQSHHIASGLANFAISVTYDQALYTYDDPQAAVPYLPVASNPTTDTLITAATDKLGILDEGFDNFTGPMTGSLTKESMTLGDEQKIKLIDSVVPKITGVFAPGENLVIDVQVGTQMSPDDSIDWRPAQQIKLQNPDAGDVTAFNAKWREAYFSAKGRYISVRFTGNQGLGTTWTLHGFYFKFRYAGDY